MEIYKLSDKLPDNSSCQKFSRGASSRLSRGEDPSELKITDIKAAVKNENRVNIFVNNKYSFSLDISQLVDLKIKVGQVITPDNLAEYKKASEYGKAYQRALEWTLTRPHSERELREYLKRRKITIAAKERQKIYQAEKQTGQKPCRNVSRPEYDFDDLIVKRLLEKGYINDRKFAEYYVENRFVKKGISRRRLEMELVKKGVESNIINDILDTRDDDAEILKIIQKKRHKYPDNDKLIAYLVRQGFQFQQAREMVQSFETDSQNLE